MRNIFLSLIITCLTLPAQSQEQRRASHCIALAEATPGITYLHQASWTEPVAKDMVRINYIDHASFLIQTEGGLSAVTDYTGFIGLVDHIPDVVTMNHAHETHWTAIPDPNIPHVLPGWNDAGGPIDHHLDLGEMLVRNVPTDIRSRYGPGLEEDGNSIFVFEVAGLCIGHLGHLHHEPDPAQYAALGRLDVVMAAVDGGVSLDLPTMKRVLERLRASIVIPMHWFSLGSLNGFVADMSESYVVERPGKSFVDVSLRSLPDRPTIVILEPAYLRPTE